MADFHVISATITNARKPACNTNIFDTDLIGFTTSSRPSVTPSVAPSVAPSVSTVPSVSTNPSVAPHSATSSSEDDCTSLDSPSEYVRILEAYSDTTKITLQ